MDGKDQANKGLLNYLIIVPKQQIVDKKYKSSKLPNNRSECKNTLQIKNGCQLHIIKSTQYSHSYIFDSIFNQLDTFVQWILIRLNQINNWSFFLNSSNLKHLIYIITSISQSLIKDNSQVNLQITEYENYQRLTKKIDQINEVKQIMQNLKENLQYSISLTLKAKYKIIIKQIISSRSIKKFTNSFKETESILIVTVIDQLNKNNLKSIVNVLELNILIKENIKSFLQNIRNKIHQNKQLKSKSIIQSQLSESSSLSSHSTRKVAKSKKRKHSKLQIENLHLKWKIKQMETQYQKQSEAYVQKMHKKIEILKNQNQHLSVQNIKINRQKEQISSQYQQVKQNYQQLLLSRDQYRKQTRLVIEQYQKRELSELQNQFLRMKEQMNLIQCQYKQQIMELNLKKQLQISEIYKRQQNIEKDYQIEIFRLKERIRILQQQYYIQKQKNKSVTQSKPKGFGIKSTEHLLRKQSKGKF